MSKETNINGKPNDYSVEEYTPDNVSGDSEQMNKYLFYCVIGIIVLLTIYKLFYGDN